MARTKCKHSFHIPIDPSTNQSPWKPTNPLSRRLVTSPTYLAYLRIINNQNLSLGHIPNTTNKHQERLRDSLEVIRRSDSLGR